MATCPAVSTGDFFLSSLLRTIDCQAQTIGTTGYQALADPASPVSLALTGLLTIFVALFGLRLMLGGELSVRDSVLAVVKIGVVLVIATSWPAYRTVVYDVIVQGPAEIGGAIGRPSGLPGSNGEMIDRLQSADAAINRLINLGSGRNETVIVFQAGGAAPGAAPQRFPISDDSAFGSARVLFLAGAVAGFALVRLMSGLLLALAPLFAGLLLFDMARGLFVGWARALVFTLLASIAVTFILGVELALLEPWLAQVLQLRQARAVTATAPLELLILCMAFAIALAGSVAVILRLAFLISLPTAPRLKALTAPAVTQSGSARVTTEQAVTAEAPSRATAVARALTAAQQREYGGRLQTAAASSSLSTRPSGGAADDFAIPASAQALRRTRPRKSLGASLRDRRS